MSVVIQLPQDINKLCRTCMKVAEDNEESFEHKIVWNNQLTELSKMLESVTTLKINIDDGLPETLCSQCTEYLNIAYLFKNHCANVDKDLRELVLVSDGKEDSGTVNSSVEGIECKYPASNIEAATVCHICVEAYKSDYELSKHLIEHNKTRSLSERFKDNRQETKPVVNQVDKNLCDLIIERKLDTLDIQDPAKNENHINAMDSDFEDSRSNSDVEETLITECKTCGKLFESQVELNSHICNIFDNNHSLAEEVASKPLFKCPLCSKNHLNMVSLSIHFLKHAFTLDIASEPSFCEACGQIFNDKVSLKNHYEESTCAKDTWVCSRCNAQFETESLLLVHEMSHDDPEANSERQGKVACILCDESFFTKENLATHTLTHLVRRYICKECSIAFCTQQAYFQHLKLHPGYQYTCIICGQLLKTKNALKSHVNGVHSEGPTYSCNVCNKGFKTPGRLKTHSHIHEEHKNYMCSYCGYTTHKSGDLQIHIRSHTSERPYKCTFANCTMKFKTSSHLCSHKRRHLNIRNFSCAICGASFGTRHSLKIHHMLHTGEKPHQCIVCGQYFRRKYHLKVHMKQHQPKAA